MYSEFTFNLGPAVNVPFTTRTQDANKRRNCVYGYTSCEVCGLCVMCDKGNLCHKLKFSTNLKKFLEKY